MSNLESLVPPLDLCRKIPAGKFADSVFVWGADCYYRFFVMDRQKSNDGIYKIHPAPTLAEIMLALDGLDEGDLPTCTFTGLKWRMESVSGPFSSTIKRHHTLDRNPATAALKLWLQLNKEG